MPFKNFHWLSHTMVYWTVLIPWYKYCQRTRSFLGRLYFNFILVFYILGAFLIIIQLFHHMRWCPTRALWKIIIKYHLCNYYSKGLITWAGLARLAGLLRCAELTFSPVLHEVSQPGWWLMPSTAGDRIEPGWPDKRNHIEISARLACNEPGWPGKRDYMETSQPG